MWSSQIRRAAQVRTRAEGPPFRLGDIGPPRVEPLQPSHPGMREALGASALCLEPALGAHAAPRMRSASSASLRTVSGSPSVLATSSAPSRRRRSAVSWRSRVSSGSSRWSMVGLLGPKARLLAHAQIMRLTVLPVNTRLPGPGMRPGWRPTPGRPGRTPWTPVRALGQPPFGRAPRRRACLGAGSRAPRQRGENRHNELNRRPFCR